MIEGEETWNNLELDTCCSSDKQHTVTELVVIGPKSSELRVG